MNVCGEVQPASSHSSCRDNPDHKAIEAPIHMMECALTVMGEG